MVKVKQKRTYQLLLPLLLLLNPALIASPCDKEPIRKVVNEALDFTVQQALYMAYSLQEKPDLLPRTADRFGNLQTCNPDWWVSGFFPGMLWYLYEYSGNPAFKKQAQDYSMRVKDQQYTRDNHDVGFIINCSFGNGYRITRDSSYRIAPGNNGNFILKHAVGHIPNNSEIDVPLIYADYYYGEVLIRYRNARVTP